MKLTFTFTTLLLHVFLLSNLHAVTFFVSESGDNGNPGTIDEPWASIQFAIDASTEGDTVALLTGTFFERISFSKSGSDGASIVLTSATGHTGTINGSGTSGQDALIEIIDQSYITVSGLKITNNTGSGAQGILISGNCLGISIIGNEIDNINFGAGSPADEDNDNAQPIIAYGDNATSPISQLTINSNNVHDCNTGFSEGIAVNGNVDGFEIVNNTVSNITNIGIDAIGGEGVATANDQARNGLIMDNDVQNCKSPYASAAGIYVDGGANILIESNLVTGCQWGIEVGCENAGATASGITVRNNFLYNNDDAAIAVGGYDFPNTGRVINSIIRNNSAVGNDALPGGVGDITGQLVVTATDGVSIFNNIFYKTNGSASMISVESGSTGLSLDYNLYYSSGSAEYDFEGAGYGSLEDYQAATLQDTNSLFADPQLRSVIPGINFHIAVPSSPAIDAGDPNTSIEPGELDGYKDDPRINGGVIDIGADEYGAVLPVKYLRPFDASIQNGEVQLSWRTAEEINNDHFQVERSRDLETWEIVNQIPAKGYSAEYYLVDNTPLVGLSYYRLRQIDTDGLTSLSAVRSILYSLDSVFSIYPNPASEFFQIKGAAEKIVAIQLMGLTGKTILEWKAVNNSDLFSLDNIAPGIYLVRVLQEGNNYTMRLVIR